jgi:hypothetical protein
MRSLIAPSNLRLGSRRDAWRLGSTISDAGDPIDIQVGLARIDHGLYLNLCPCSGCQWLRGNHMQQLIIKRSVAAPSHRCPVGTPHYEVHQWFYLSGLHFGRL